jgi:excisionase family DNA binding protein
MNLADAIRKASTDGPGSTASQVPAAFQHVPEGPNLSDVESAVAQAIGCTQPPEQPHPSVVGGNVVRIELFLTADQTTTMLRAIMSGQHSVLTLSEAAHFLRVRSQTLSKMAEDGEVPAALIDGRWRFLKNDLEEWISTSVGHHEDDRTDVA